MLISYNIINGNETRIWEVISGGVIIADKIKVITIDGPSASGKGALSRKIANHFNLNILDSGALYRIFAYLYDLNMTLKEIANAIKHKINFKLEEDNLRILNQDIDITYELRTEDIAKMASTLSSKEDLYLREI